MFRKSEVDVSASLLFISYTKWIKFELLLMIKMFWIVTTKNKINWIIKRWLIDDKLPNTQVN